MKNNQLIKIEPVRCNEINRVSLTDVVGQLITKVALVAGFPLQESAMKVMLEEVPKDLQTRFRLLELPEVEKAFDDGVRGIYGDYYGISTVTIHKWLKAYVDAGEHQRYIENKPKPENQKMIEEATTMTEEEYDTMIRKGIVRCFTDYQINGLVVDYGNPKFDWLWNKGILRPTDMQIAYYIASAREELNQEALNLTNSMYRDDKHAGKRMFEALLNAKDEEGFIQSKAKNIALRDWFEYLLDSGDDIHEKIK